MFKGVLRERLVGSLLCCHITGFWDNTCAELSSRPSRYDTMQ